MTKYFLTWEIVESRMPDDPKTIAGSWNMMLETVKADLQGGPMKDWGAFPGDRAGYAIVEGNEIDVMKVTMKFAPFVRFLTRPVVGVKQVADFLHNVK